MGSDKVQKAFDAFDTDGSGELDLDEFREAITSLGMTLSDKQFSEVRCCCLLFVVCCCCCCNRRRLKGVAFWTNRAEAHGQLVLSPLRLPEQLQSSR